MATERFFSEVQLTGKMAKRRNILPIRGHFEAKSEPKQVCLAVQPLIPLCMTYVILFI